MGSCNSACFKKDVAPVVESVYEKIRPDLKQLEQNIINQLIQIIDDRLKQITH